VAEWQSEARAAAPDPPFTLPLCHSATLPLRCFRTASSLRDQKGEVRLASSHMELKIGYIFTTKKFGYTFPKGINYSNVTVLAFNEHLVGTGVYLIHFPLVL
jgi:hypothetical protein